MPDAAAPPVPSPVVAMQAIIAAIAKTILDIFSLTIKLRCFSRESDAISFDRLVCLIPCKEQSEAEVSTVDQ
jgi:hypothetical protein